MFFLDLLEFVKFDACACCHGGGVRVGTGGVDVEHSVHTGPGGFVQVAGVDRKDTVNVLKLSWSREIKEVERRSRSSYQRERWLS